MKIIKKINSTLSLISVFVIVCSSLTGCATAGKNAIPQTGDMTMADIYKQETGLTPNALNNNHVEAYQDLSDIRTEIKNQKIKPNLVSANLASGKKLFKPLPNPEIAMYVYPHLVRQNEDFEPVPGYSTAFFLYQKNQFAMPSEVY